MVLKLIFTQWETLSWNEDTKIKRSAFTTYNSVPIWLCKFRLLIQAKFPFEYFAAALISTHPSIHSNTRMRTPFSDSICARYVFNNLLLCEHFGISVIVTSAPGRLTLAGRWVIFTREYILSRSIESICG